MLGIQSFTYTDFAGSENGPLEVALETLQNFNAKLFIASALGPELQEREAQSPALGKDSGQAAGAGEESPEVAESAAFALFKSGDFPQALAMKRRMTPGMKMMFFGFMVFPFS
jgi:hypothetical protein